MQEPNNSKTPGFWQVMKSTAAAAFGVQSSKNLHNDFQHGKAIHFIIAGIIFAAIFLFVVFSFVKLQLN
jgi:hypothetical protein